MANSQDSLFSPVEGENKGDIIIYALSTCGWCRKTKSFFNDHNVAYSYVDVDQLPEDVRGDVLKKQRGYNPSGSFPTIVVDGGNVIVGYDLPELEKLTAF